YVLEFREFREITLFAENGAPIVSSRVGKPRITAKALGESLDESPIPNPKSEHIVINGVRMAPFRLDDDQLPTTTFSVRLTHLNQPAGWLAGEFSLEEMWRMVDLIRIGSAGFALVIAPGGELIAHGHPDKKNLVARSQQKWASHPLLAATPVAS